MKRKTLFNAIILLMMAVIAACTNPASNQSKEQEGPKPGAISGKALFAQGDNHAGIIITLEKTEGLLSVNAAVQARSIGQGASGMNAARSFAGMTQTDGDGSFLLTGITPGSYTVYASSQNAMEQAVKINLSVVSGETTDAGTLTLTPAGSVSGRITLDGSSTGNFGFVVAVAGTSYSSATDMEGYFTISGIPAGNGYYILIMKGNSVIVWPEDSSPSAAPKAVAVSGGQTTELGTKALSSADILKGSGNISIGPNGNWFINGVDTGINAQGQDGKDGENACTLSFHANGGLPVPESPVATVRGASIEEPAEQMEKNGYSFAGWHLDERCALLAVFPLIIDADTALYAKWEEIPGFIFYNVRFLSNGGSPVADQRTAENSPAERPEAPVKSGYSFTGWYSDMDLTLPYGFDEPVTHNIVLYAGWVYSAGLPIVDIGDLALYLAGQNGGASEDDPVPLELSVCLTEDNWLAVLAAIDAEGKFVSLDLSACSRSEESSGGGLRSDGIFDTSYTVNADRVVSLILPDAAENIVEFLYESPFSNFPNLKTVSGINITAIPRNAFANLYKLVDAHFPTAKAIGDNAFYGCSGLTSAEFPAAESFGAYAFSECLALPVINIAADLSSIGEFAFMSCVSLTAIHVAEDNPLYSSIDGVLYNKTQDLLIKCPDAKTGAVNMPASLNSIDEYAFMYCSGLTITIPSGVANLYNTFYACRDMTVTIQANYFIGWMNVFINNTRLNIILSSNISSIGDSEFASIAGLTGIVIPSSVASIGNYAFYGCSSLASVSFLGAISGGNFSSANAFPGDLRDKYFAAGGGAGTYTTANPGASPIWVKY